MKETTQQTEVVFLDAAGTLFELAEPVGVTYARIAAAHGVVVEAAAVDHAFRCTWKELPTPVHPENAPPQDDDRAWWEELVRGTFEKVLGEAVETRWFGELFASLYAHFAQGRAWRLFDDVPPAIEAMHGKVRMFVVSNFDRRLHAILRGLGIAEFFEAVILSSEVGASKPHARIFQSALRAAGVAPQHCLHAGDEEKADVLGAQAAGLPAMWIRRPEVTLLDVAAKVLPGTFSRLRVARK